MGDVTTFTDNSHGWSQSIFFRVQAVVTAFLYFPLLQLYWYGPAIAGYGFWAGREPEDICSEITHIPSDHWTIHHDVCMKYILVRFESFLMAITLIFYLVFIYCLVRSILSMIRMILVWYFQKKRCVCQAKLSPMALDLNQR